MENTDNRNTSTSCTLTSFDNFKVFLGRYLPFDNLEIYFMHITTKVAAHLSHLSCSVFVCLCIFFVFFVTIPPGGCCAFIFASSWLCSTHLRWLSLYSRLRNSIYLVFLIYFTFFELFSTFSPNVFLCFFGLLGSLRSLWH